MSTYLRSFSALIFMFQFHTSISQEFIPLWPDNRLPNSKGIPVEDSIVNERILHVGKPGMLAFYAASIENKRAAILICPGGGYERIAYIASGTQLAKWFNSIGVNAFVLLYPPTQFS